MIGTALDPLRILLACVGCSALHANVPAAERTPLDAWRIEEVTEIALLNRAEIAAANARAEAFVQRPAIVGSLEDPMISPSIDHYPFDMPAGEMDDGGGRPRYDWSVSVEQRFPLSGVRAQRRAAALAEADRARALAEGAALDVAIDAQRNFFMLFERRQMKGVLDAQLALAQQLVSAASSRYASGGGTQVDVLRAEVEVARVRASRRVLDADIRAAEAMLNASLGRPPQERIPDLVHVSSREPPPPSETAIDRALVRRPELAAGEAEVKRAAAEIDVMRSMYKPMATVRVGRASTMAEGPGGMIMIGVSVPIWRDRLRAGVAEARAMQRMADSDLIAMRRMVEAEASAAREMVVAARTQLLVLEDDVLPRAQAATEAALATYSSGQGTLVSLIDSARALWDVQAEHVMAEATLGGAWARLHRAMGGVARGQP